ncbi:MAG: ArnT family glycosyltransferase [Nitrospinota bacterium]
MDTCLTKKKSNSAIVHNEEKDYLLWVLSFFIIFVTIVVRIRLLDIPFERDEGEYAYTARLILSGIPPYLEAYDLKMPLLHCFYASFLYFFGDSVKGVHTGLLLVNGLTVVCMFFIGRRLYCPSGGVLSASAFAVLSLSQRVYGFSANAEPLLLLPVLCGVLFLTGSQSSKRMTSVFFAGIFFGIAFMIKQTAIFFILFALCYTLACDYKTKKPSAISTFKGTFFLGAGVLIPFLVVSFALFWAGAFENFLFWTFRYAYSYGVSTPIDIGLKSLKNALTWVLPPVLVFWSAAGVFLMILVARGRKSQETFFSIVFFLFSVLSVSAGLYFREHYFILLLPAVSLFFAGGAIHLREYCKKKIWGQTVQAGILCAAVLHTFYSERAYLFHYTPEEVSRNTFTLNPFAESKEIAGYIKRHSTPEERLAVLGSEPQLFFYAERLSATRHIVMYPLMHPNALDMQMELIRDIENAAPKFLVFVKVPGSWGLKTESKKLVFSWVNTFVEKHYIKTGVVEIVPPEPPKFYWEDEVEKRREDISNGVYIFKRR